MTSARRVRTLAIALLAAGSALVVAPAAQARDRCAYAGARVRTQTKALRLYALSRKNSQDWYYYICVRSNGRRFRVDNRNYPDSVQYFRNKKLFAASGKFVAFALSYYVSEDVAGLSIVVLNITSGKRTEYLQDIHHVFSRPGVPSLVLRPTGSAAWVLTPTLLSGDVAPREVRRTASKGDALLDSGAGIAPASLKLSGKTLSWTNAGISRTATLN